MPAQPEPVRPPRKKRTPRFHPSRVSSRITLAEFVTLAAQLCPDDPTSDLARCRAWQALSRTEDFLNLGAATLNHVAEHGTMPPPIPSRESEHERNLRFGNAASNAFLPLSEIAGVRASLNSPEIRKASRLEIVEAVADDKQLKKWLEAFVNGTQKCPDRWRRVAGKWGDADCALQRADVPYLAIYIKYRAPSRATNAAEERRGYAQGHAEAIKAAQTSFASDHPFDKETIAPVPSARSLFEKTRY